jgi:hypothetical protein
MEDVIQSMITLVLEQSKLSGKQHEEAMEELREMRELQREQRVDIMALFDGNRELRDTFKKYFERRS